MPKFKALINDEKYIKHIDQLELEDNNKDLNAHPHQWLARRIYNALSSNSNHLDPSEKTFIKRYEALKQKHSESTLVEYGQQGLQNYSDNIRYKAEVLLYAPKSTTKLKNILSTLKSDLKIMENTPGLGDTVKEVQKELENVKPSKGNPLYIKSLNTLYDKLDTLVLEAKLEKLALDNGTSVNANEIAIASQEVMNAHKRRTDGKIHLSLNSAESSETDTVSLLPKERQDDKAATKYNPEARISNEELNNILVNDKNILPTFPRNKLLNDSKAPKPNMHQSAFNKIEEKAYVEKHNETKVRSTVDRVMAATPFVSRVAGLGLLAASGGPVTAGVGAAAFVFKQGMDVNELTKKQNLEAEHRLLQEYIAATFVEEKLRNKLEEKAPGQYDGFINTQDNKFSYNEIVNNQKTRINHNLITTLGATSESADHSTSIGVSGAGVAETAHHSMSAGASSTADAASNAGEVARLFSEIGTHSTSFGLGALATLMEAKEKREYNKKVIKPMTSEITSMRDHVPFYPNLTELSNLIKEKELAVHMNYALTRLPDLNSENFAAYAHEINSKLPTNNDFIEVSKPRIIDSLKRVGQNLIKVNNPFHDASVEAAEKRIQNYSQGCIEQYDHILATADSKFLPIKTKDPEKTTEPVDKRNEGFPSFLEELSDIRKKTSQFIPQEGSAVGSTPHHPTTDTPKHGRESFSLIK